MLRRSAGGLVLVLVIIVGCQQPTEELQPFQPPTSKDYGRPLPPGRLALRQIPPEQYPDFGRGFGRRSDLEAAIRDSLDYLAKPSSQRYYPYGDITHARVVASLEHFLTVLETADTPEALNAAVRRDFDVYQSVGWDERGTVFFTGYYCPIFDGRAQRDAQFRYPLYAWPADMLAKDEDGQILGQRRADGTVAPRCPTRRELEEGRLLDGHEIAWLRDPFEAYVITVQGSAKLRLADGSLLELGYAGSNGHEYTPISTAMIADGVIGRDDLSLQTLLRYFRQHPEQIFHYAWKNDRYVFFQRTDGGPFGCLNTPVTPYRSLATDKEIFPRAALAFVDTDLPTNYGGPVRTLPYAGFALDHDRGAAIRAAGRCDIFIGTGPEAEALAGRTGAEGALYYLFVRENAGVD